MCFLNLFKRTSQTVENADPKKRPLTSFLGGKISSSLRDAGDEEIVGPDAPDEEYLLPILTKGSFAMSEELCRRQQAELLRQKYGIRSEKEGSLV